MVNQFGLGNRQKSGPNELCAEQTSSRSLAAALRIAAVLHKLRAVHPPLKLEQIDAALQQSNNLLSLFERAPECHLPDCVLARKFSEHFNRPKLFTWQTLCGKIIGDAPCSGKWKKSGVVFEVLVSLGEIWYPMDA